MENLKDTEFNPTDEEIFFSWEDKDGAWDEMMENLEKNKE